MSHHTGLLLCTINRISSIQLSQNQSSMEEKHNWWLANGHDVACDNILYMTYIISVFDTEDLIA